MLGYNNGGLIKLVMVKGRKLYNGTRKNEYLFMKMYFQSTMYINFFKKNIENKTLNVLSIGQVRLKIHEESINTLLQFVTEYKVPFQGWVTFNNKGISSLSDSIRESYCDIEYCIDLDIGINKSRFQQSNYDTIITPVIMSMDIEVYSSVINTFPQAKRHDDKVFQISAVVLNKKGEKDKYLLTLGEPDSELVGTDVEIRMFDTEIDLLRGYTDLVNDVNPQVIIGYNIFGFDIQYMIDRSKFHYILDIFCKQSMIKSHVSELRPIQWSSSAYGNQKLAYLDTDGRIHIDLLPIVRRNYNLENYKLQTVAQKFIGKSKDPLTPGDIFKCFELFTPESLALVGKYNVQDSAIVLELFEHLQTWYELVELARICCVPIIYTYTRGQQIRVFSQVYQECQGNNTVINKSDSAQYSSDNYTGATVFEPVHGIHKNVVSFDFNSLYPSTQIAYNISYDTIVTDETIPDCECNVIEWEEHVNCECLESIVDDKRDRVCCTKKYRFRKEPIGVLPVILKNLLDARAKTRQKMKGEHDKLMLQVLDKRQLAYKVSSNSVYGSMGTSEGYLPFNPGAECTTAMGRKNIQKAREFLYATYNANLLYGDTDSVYLTFPDVPLENLNEFCFKVQDEVSAIFPRPMKMAYEEKIMKYFLIFTKKRYIAQGYPKPGKPEGEIINKGVILVRRDSCRIAREIFNGIITSIFQGKNADDVRFLVIEYLNNIYTFRYPYTYFKITKSIRDVSEYKIRKLPTDDAKKYKRLHDLGCADEKEYQTLALPPHIQLAERMNKRGSQPTGNRIEYVIISVNKACKSDDALFRKIEDLDYFGRHRDVLRLDFQHYLEHMVVNPITELLHVIGIGPEFLKQQVTLRRQKKLVTSDIESLSDPTIIFG
jgi:DNA polymerase elongation subunit (family B)